MIKNTSFSSKSMINLPVRQAGLCGKLFDLSSPKIMGILNATPDSFFRGSKYTNETEIIKRVEAMFAEGADVIDVGGNSTRPGAKVVSAEEELKRVIPVVRSIKKHFLEAVVSIDTFYAKVAKAAVQEGAAIVNDISAGTMDEDMLKTVAELQTPYVLMHMQGTPAIMQDSPVYEDVVMEIMDFFVEKIQHLQQLGVKDIILDPGFGFGKTLEHNYEILKKLDYFKLHELPLLAGVSRKSMICKLLKVNPENALNGTTAVHILALQKGAKLLRVHDVKAAKEAVKIFEVSS